MLGINTLDVDVMSNHLNTLFSFCEELQQEWEWPEKV